MRWQVLSDGRREGVDHVDGYRLEAADGTVLVSRPLTPAEDARLTEFEAAPVRDANTAALEQQARNAIATNDAYLARPTPTFPLTVAAQQILYEQTLALTRQNRVLIRLAVGNDLLD